MRLLMFFIALAVVLPASASDVARFASGEHGFAVNSWLVPTERGVVVIDTQFTVTEADRLVQAVIREGRPLKAIIITHPHPDHYNGTCRLLELARVPVYATQATIDGDPRQRRIQTDPVEANIWEGLSDTTCAPDHAVPIGSSVRIDGLEFQFPRLRSR